MTFSCPSNLGGCSGRAGRGKVVRISRNCGRTRPIQSAVERYYFYRFSLETILNPGPKDIVAEALVTIRAIYRFKYLGIPACSQAEL